jgi:hypothetical protein
MRVVKFFQLITSKNVLLISKEEASDRYGKSILSTVLQKFGNNMMLYILCLPLIFFMYVHAAM